MYFQNKTKNIYKCRGMFRKIEQNNESPAARALIAPCFPKSNNHRYESLNISTLTSDPSLGGFGDTNGIFVNDTNAANSCNSQTTPTGILVDPSPHASLDSAPEIEVDVGYHISFLERSSPVD